MTAKEAIEILQEEHDWAQLLSYVKTAIKLAISALEKQIPKKPDISGDSCDKDGNLIYDTYNCPNCHTSYEIEYEKYNYCPSCGQAFDWDEGVND